MNLQLPQFRLLLATSANGAMVARPGRRLILICISSPPLMGTNARTEPPEDWQTIPEDPAQAGTSAGASAAGEEQPVDTGAAIAELRRLSGLTWEQLARLFGVARRSLHFWASGKPLNASNEERLRRLIAVLRQADRGNAQENRAMLFGDHDGTVPFDLLAEGQYEAFLALVGKGPGRRRPELPPLSRATLEARKPPPPEELVEALHESVHRDVGRGRAARTVRGRRRGRG